MTASPLPTSIAGAEIHLGRVGAELPGATSSGVLWQAATGRFLLRVPGVARYLVEGGEGITVDVETRATSDEVRRFLLGTPLAAVYLQRGMPVLHAAVVAPPGGSGALVLAGDSGSGKSVLAASLWARGYQVVADDLAPITVDDSGTPVVLPTAGALILWPDAVERLGLANCEPTVCGPEGRRLRIDPGNFAPEPVPVAAVWRLTTHSPDIEVVDITGVDRFAAVGTFSFNSRIADALLDRHAYLTLAGAVAASAIPIRRLARPRGRWSVNELADTVEGALVA